MEHRTLRRRSEYSTYPNKVSVVSIESLVPAADQLDNDDGVFDSSVGDLTRDVGCILSE
jgi:hypothetical protein